MRESASRFGDALTVNVTLKSAVLYSTSHYPAIVN